MRDFEHDLTVQDTLRKRIEEAIKVKTKTPALSDTEVWLRAVEGSKSRLKKMCDAAIDLSEAYEDPKIQTLAFHFGMVRREIYEWEEGCATPKDFHQMPVAAFGTLLVRTEQVARRIKAARLNAMTEGQAETA